jgi:hypothetical protein
LTLELLHRLFLDNPEKAGEGEHARSLFPEDSPERRGLVPAYP